MRDAQTQRDQLAAAVSAGAPMVTEQPTFHQPFPFSTNTHWQEEIALGPGPPKKGKGYHQANGKAGGRSLTQVDDDYASDDGMNRNNPDNVRSGREQVQEALDDRWNRTRYEREEEALWGQAAKGSSVGISRGDGGGLPGDQKNDFELSDIVSAGAPSRRTRNPAINELHPPVVCTPRSRDETRWMLQPLPSAKVMAGKIPSDRAGRASRASTKSRTHSSRRAAREPRQKSKVPKAEKQNRQRSALPEHKAENDVSGETGDLHVPKNNSRAGSGAIDDADSPDAPNGPSSPDRITSENHHQKNGQHPVPTPASQPVALSSPPSHADKLPGSPDFADEYLLHNGSKVTAVSTTTNGSTSQPSSLLQPVESSTMSPSASPASWAALLSEREKHFNLGEFAEREATADSGKAFTLYSPHTAPPPTSNTGSDVTAIPPSRADERKQNSRSALEADKFQKFNVDKILSQESPGMATPGKSRWSMDL